MNINPITTEQLKVQIHHIGGIGECGPAEILEHFNRFSKWTFYDADKKALEDITGYEDKEYKLVQKCIGGSNTKGTFYITKTPSASGLFKSAKSAKDYVLKNSVEEQTTTWGQQTEVVDTKEVDIYTLDTLIKSGEVEPIDFLSIDAQGAELDIINGTDLSGVAGIICETEFVPLYENQPLFYDIHKKLHESGFRFCLLFNPQFMKVSKYPDSFGFMTVAETFFLKDPTDLLNNLENMPIEERTKAVIQLLKLSAISICFNQTDLAMQILFKLEKLISLEKLAKECEGSIMARLLRVISYVKYEKQQNE